MSKKYYYINENGIKKYYAGKIINDYVTNETYGLLTIQETIKEEKPIEWHNEKPAIEGWSSYFTYIDENGDKVRYTDSIGAIRRNIDNSYYITKINKDEINLIRHPEVKEIPAYFSFINEDGKEEIYEGKPFFDKFTSTYYFYK